jgi:arylsulfatase A-like enzyme
MTILTKQNQMGKRYIFALLATVILSCNGKTENQDTKKKRPNIVFAILDDASYWHFGAYGCDWVETPNFDKLADQGILFTNAYTPNAKCAPSRSTVLTGRNPWQLEEAANHWCFFPKSSKPIPKYFRNTVTT